MALVAPHNWWQVACTQQRQQCETPFRARAHWPLCSTTSGRVFVAGIFIPVGNHYFQALASTLQFVAQVCDRLWLVPATDRAFAYITYMSPPHVALVCSGPPQCAATCGWTKWPVCSGPYITRLAETPCATHTWQGTSLRHAEQPRNTSSTRKNAHIARGLQNISPLMEGKFLTFGETSIHKVLLEFFANQVIYLNVFKLFFSLLNFLQTNSPIIIIQLEYYL